MLGSFESHEHHSDVIRFHGILTKLTLSRYEQVGVADLKRR